MLWLRRLKPFDRLTPSEVPISAVYGYITVGAEPVYFADCWAECARSCERGFAERQVITAATETLTAGPGLPGSMTDSAVDPEEVRHVASLARVDLEEDEVDRFTEQFADILASFERLDEVPETEAEPDLTNVMRPDEERECLS